MEVCYAHRRLRGPFSRIPFAYLQSKHGRSTARNPTGTGQKPRNTNCIQQQPRPPTSQLPSLISALPLNSPSQPTFPPTVFLFSLSLSRSHSPQSRVSKTRERDHGGSLPQGENLEREREHTHPLPRCHGNSTPLPCGDFRTAAAAAAARDSRAGGAPPRRTAARARGTPHDIYKYIYGRQGGDPDRDREMQSLDDDARRFVYLPGPQAFTLLSSHSGIHTIPPYYCGRHLSAARGVRGTVAQGEREICA